MHCNQHAQVVRPGLPAFDVRAVLMLASNAVPAQPADVPASCKVSGKHSRVTCPVVKHTLTEGVAGGRGAGEGVNNRNRRIQGRRHVGLEN